MELKLLSIICFDLFIDVLIVLVTFDMILENEVDIPFNEVDEIFFIAFISRFTVELIPLKLESTSFFMPDALLVTSDSKPLKSLAPDVLKSPISPNDELVISLISPVTFELRLDMSVDPLDSRSPNIPDISDSIPLTVFIDSKDISSMLPVTFESIIFMSRDPLDSKSPSIPVISVFIPLTES